MAVWDRKQLLVISDGLKRCLETAALDAETKAALIKISVEIEGETRSVNVSAAQVANFTQKICSTCHCAQLYSCVEDARWGENCGLWKDYFS